MLAVAFLAAGVTHWIRILVLPASPTGSLLRLPLTDRVETIAYAVLDPISAVGLWLTAPWGIVVWLITAVSRMVLSSGFARGSELDILQLAVQAGSIAVYLGLSQLVGIISLIPLGLGAVDGSLAALLERFGMTLEQGAAVALLARLTQTLPLIIAAFACYAWLVRNAPVHAQDPVPQPPPAA